MPLRIFPVASVPGVVDANDFAAPRSGGRTHEGNDILAPEGTPLFAVDDGEARFGTDPLGGNVVNLIAADGTRYYYAHLSGFVSGAAVGTRRAVNAGDVVGFVGRTGNAAGPGIPSHLHFEMHPGGGAAIDPFPALSRAEKRTATSVDSLLFPLAMTAGLAGVVYWYYRKNPAAFRTPALAARRAAGRLRTSARPLVRWSGVRT